MKKYIILLSGILWACTAPETPSETSDTSNELTAEQMANAKIEIAQLRKHELSETIRVNGFLDVPPNQKAEINSMVAGTISRLDLIVGDKVQKGQEVARLISPEFIRLQQAYFEQKNELRLLEQEYFRSKELYQEKIASQKEFMQAEAYYLSANARLESIRQQLRLMHVDFSALNDGRVQDYVSIRSPLSGEITKVPIVLGRHVAPGDILLQIVNTDHVHADLKVFERDLVKLAKGQKVEIQLGSAIYSGKIFQLSTILDEVGRFGSVHVHFDKELSNPQIGAYLEAVITLSSEAVWAVEEAAMVKTTDGGFIYTAELKANGYTFTPLKVKPGRTLGDLIELIDPKENVTYVSKGVYYLAKE